MYFKDEERRMYYANSCLLSGIEYYKAGELEKAVGKFSCALGIYVEYEHVGLRVLARELLKQYGFSNQEVQEIENYSVGLLRWVKNDLSDAIRKVLGK